LFIRSPTPSIIDKMTPPNKAETIIALLPIRAQSSPPVNAPAEIEFHGSS
jgi:hypothetical protein